MRGVAIACALALCGCSVYRARAPATGLAEAAPRPRIYVPAPDEYPTLGQPNLLKWNAAAGEGELLQRAGLDAVVVTAASQIPADAPYVVRVSQRSLGDGDDCGGFVGQTVLTLLTVGLWPSYSC